jgi:hypothetical protein
MLTLSVNQLKRQSNSDVDYFYLLLMLSRIFISMEINTTYYEFFEK